MKTILSFLIFLLSITGTGYIKPKKKRRVSKISREYERPKELNKVICRLKIGPSGEIINREYISGSICHIAEMGKYINQLPLLNNLTGIDRKPITIRIEREFEP